MKIRLIFLMLLAMVALASCNKSYELEDIAIDSSALESVRFNISSGDIMTRSGDGGSINRYVIEVWNATGDTVVNCFNDSTYRSVQSDSLFTMILNKELEYTILFWADYKESDSLHTYNADDLKKVSLVSGQAMTEHAYFAKMTGKLEYDNSISLNRAVAKINYVQSGGYTDGTSKTLTVRYAENYSFNCKSGDVTVLEGEGRVFTTNVVIKDTILATDYIFASAVASKNTLMNLGVNIAGEGESKELTNIPLNANKVTNVIGQYSSQVQLIKFTFSLLDEWDAAYNDHILPKITLDQVSDTTLIMPSVGDNNKVISFTSMKAWTVSISISDSIYSDSTSWCILSNKKGESGGDSEFTITATANESGVDRIATITISSGGVTETIKLMQSKNMSTSVAINLQSLDGFYVFTVSDRNAGINVPMDGIALNYSNDTTHIDNSNLLFKGDYYTWDEAIAGKNSDTTDICPSGWRLPVEEELEVIVNAMQVSDNRAYLAGSDGNRCYFPLSGRSSGISDVRAYYWSSTESEKIDDYAWFLSAKISDSTIYWHTAEKSQALSVRCVKTVTE